jgi:hypothetical protein
MKTSGHAVSVIFLVAGLLVFASCSLRPPVPDPVKVQEEIAEYHREELALISATITDPERANRMIQLLAERDNLIEQSTGMINAYRQELSLLNADYHAERELFESLVADFNSERALAQGRLTEVIGAMKREASPEEWKVISRFQLKRLHPRQLAYGQTTTGG